jgi:tetratricopeptide (TPR) repeat protein
MRATRILAVFVLVLLPLALLQSACGAASPRWATTPVSPERVLDMEEMRITARSRADGSFDLDSYDAETLFQRALVLLNSAHCPDAVTLYDRLADEFPTSRFRSASLYNAGYCLQGIGESDEAVRRFERLLDEGGDPEDVRHASFQLAKIRIDQEEWIRGREIADALLMREDLTPEERLEAMARRAQALLGLEQLEDAERQARSALLYFRSRPEEQRVRDEQFAAAANYVLAQTYDARASAIVVPVAAVEEQHATLERRAQLMLDAQREYFNTIGMQNPHWAAVAGYRIGAMYDAFWTTIMTAPTPPPRRPLPPGTEAAYEEEYRMELARMLKPLVRHAIRYWELTLMMVERTAVRSAWTDRIREDLARARTRLLAQPSDAPPEAFERGSSSAP